MTVSATSDSTSVNPRERLFGSSVDRNNLSSSRQPIDANLKPRVSASQFDRPAARHAAREELDRRAGRSTIACLREQGVEGHVARQLNTISASARVDRARARVEHGCDLRAAPNGGVAIGAKKRRGLERISFQPRPRCRARDGRQNQGGEQRDNGQGANDFEKRKSGVALHGAAIAPRS
jgi:hypothetical protein